MKSLLLAIVVVVLTSAVNGQPSLFTTVNYRNLNGYDVSASTAIINSFAALNKYTCLYVCWTNSNCAFVVFKSSDNTCNAYSSSAVNQVVITTSSGSNWLYQKQISG
jgi:hypothetical protein